MQLGLVGPLADSQLYCVQRLIRTLLPFLAIAYSQLTISLSSPKDYCGFCESFADPRGLQGRTLPGPIFIARKRSYGKVMFYTYLSVILGGRGVSV